MKRTISIILVFFLVATTATLLVACGGIANAEAWNKAIEAYKTADAVTVKIEDNNKMVNQLANKERLISTVEVSFDAQKGMVHISVEYTRRNFWESEIGAGSYEIYYVLDGANVISYKKNLKTQQWETKTIELENSEASEAYLRERYLKPTDPDDRQFPILTELKYDDFKADLFGNYKWTPTDSRFSYTYTLNFANGKPSKFTYQHKTASKGNVDDTRKFSMTIKYSADITLPNDLPAVGNAD